jgi:hypothetical protein
MVLHIELFRPLLNRVRPLATYRAAAALTALALWMWAAVTAYGMQDYGDRRSGWIGGTSTATTAAIGRLCTPRSSRCHAESQTPDAPVPTESLVPAGAGLGAVAEAIAFARRQPAPILNIHEHSQPGGTLWLNLSDPDTPAILRHTLYTAGERRVEIRLVAFGPDPAIVGKTVLLHMVAEAQKLAGDPPRLVKLVSEIGSGDYWELAQRYRAVPSCMRIAARLRVDADTLDAERALKRIDKTVIQWTQ